MEKLSKIKKEQRVFYIILSVLFFLFAVFLLISTLKFLSNFPCYVRVRDFILDDPEVRFLAQIATLLGFGVLIDLLKEISFFGKKQEELNEKFAAQLRYKEEMLTKRHEMLEEKLIDMDKRGVGNSNQEYKNLIKEMEELLEEIALIKSLDANRHAK